LTFERDFNLPWQIASLAEIRGRLIAYSAQSADNARVASSALQSVENAFKGLSGRRQALTDPVGFARVAATEQDLQTRVRRNRAATREVGDAWGEVGRAIWCARPRSAQNPTPTASRATPTRVSPPSSRACAPIAR
jgi:hypothetical protein